MHSNSLSCVILQFSTNEIAQFRLSLLRHAQGAFMKPPSTFWGASGAAQVRGFVMLHELGHELSPSTGFFNSDSSDSPNGPTRQFINNLRLNYNCQGGVRH
jgi:hypothetical protein